MVIILPLISSTTEPVEIRFDDTLETSASEANWPVFPVVINPDAVKSPADPSAPAGPAAPLGPKASCLMSTKCPLVTPVVNEIPVVPANV